MKPLSIIFNTEKDVRAFLSITAKIPYDLDLQYGHCVVDAKSLLGILSLGMGKELELHAIADQGEVKRLEDKLKGYCI